MTQSMSDPHAVLGIPSDASRQTALEAYRRLAKQFHPDVAADPAAGQRMRRINEAWRVLSIPTRRARYDARPAGRPSSDDRSRRFRQSPRSTSSQRAHPPRPDVHRESASPLLVIVVAAAASFLFLGIVGFLPPLFVLLFAVGVGRMVRGIL